MCSERYNRLAAGLASVFVCLSAVLLFPLTSGAEGPTEEMRGSIDAVIGILNNKELQAPENREKRRSKIRNIVDERFDFREMSKRSMARHWRRISQTQQDELVPVYADLLVATYVKRIERYQDEEVRYDSESIDGSYAKVDTMIVSPDRNFEIPVEYRLIKKGDHWKVYDVVIEGISLVNNYRSQFNTIMRSGSFDNLISRLKIKVKDMKKED